MPKTGRNLWMLTVLSLLDQAPRHPYDMKRLIGDRHKDMFLNLKPGSLYHAIGVLEHDRLIEPLETQRVGRRPQRTVYRITRAGRAELRRWLRTLLSDTGHGHTAFFAAISFLPHLAPATARAALRQRVGRLNAEIGVYRHTLKVMTPVIGRIPLLEIEYALAMRRAELKWTSDLIESLGTGALNWNPVVIRKTWK